MVKAKKEVKKEIKTEITLKQLLEAGCHFGHQSRRWNPRMKQYLFGVREKIHIFDLVKTKEGLETACAFAKASAVEGKAIVFVGTKRQARSIVEEQAKKAGAFYVIQRWIGGTITNWKQIKKSLEKLAEMKEKREKGEYKKYTKREQLLLDREINRLEKFFGGLVGLDRAPEVLFIVDVKKEDAAVKEATTKEVPILGLVDSDSNPDPIGYVIPANDDAVGSIKFVVEKIAEAVKEGKGIHEKSKSKPNKD